jgi:hypothetical protein
MKNKTKATLHAWAAVGLGAIVVAAVCGAVYFILSGNVLAAVACAGAVPVAWNGIGAEVALSDAYERASNIERASQL